MYYKGRWWLEVAEAPRSAPNPWVADAQLGGVELGPEAHGMRSHGELIVRTLSREQEAGEDIVRRTYEDGRGDCQYDEQEGWSWQGQNKTPHHRKMEFHLKTLLLCVVTIGCCEEGARK